MKQGTVDTVIEGVKTQDRDHNHCSMENPLGLYNLGEACRRFFPGLSIDTRDLKKEARRGRLKLIRIGKQLCVSEEARKPQENRGGKRPYEAPRRGQSELLHDRAR
ncbi:MAG: hypothetical protein P8Y36_08330 [Alphaproteobacteria bacterium]